MVGRLSLREVPDLPDMRKRGDSGLDSPDSGLPPSPGPAPPPWLLSSGSPDRAANGIAEPEPPAPSAASSVFSPSPVLSSCPPRLCPLSFGEGVEFDPLPAKEIRYTSQLRYGSERRFVAAVFLRQALSVAGCSQSVLCVPDCSWRRYRSEVRLQPRHRAQRFACTTIVYPKHAQAACTTTLDYDRRKAARRFLASVELETAECPAEGC